jgi:hypothetical protein
MNRRTAVINFIVFSAGSVLLPSCLQQDATPVISLNNLRINDDQEKLLSALTETILPATGTPGAKELSSHLFVLMMVDDCFNKEEQEKFSNGLTRFDELVRKQTSQSFIKTSPEQRHELLTMLESKNDLSADLVSFYKTTKKLTMQSFTGSRYYLTKVRPYEMAPGRFHGCFPVNSSTKI